MSDLLSLSLLRSQVRRATHSCSTSKRLIGQNPSLKLLPCPPAAFPGGQPHARGAACPTAGNTEARRKARISERGHHEPVWWLNLDLISPHSANLGHQVRWPEGQDQPNTLPLQQVPTFPGCWGMCFGSSFCSFPSPSEPRVNCSQGCRQRAFERGGDTDDFCKVHLHPRSPYLQGYQQPLLAQPLPQWGVGANPRMAHTGSKQRSGEPFARGPGTS